MQLVKRKVNQPRRPERRHFTGTPNEKGKRREVKRRKGKRKRREMSIGNGVSSAKRCAKKVTEITRPLRDEVGNRCGKKKRCRRMN